MSEAANDYWADAFMETLEALGMSHVFEAMTKEQLSEAGQSLAVYHENYGMAFYSPPPSDRINSIEREWKEKYEALRKEFEVYERNAEKAVIRIAKLPSYASVSIGKYGEVTRHE